MFHDVSLSAEIDFTCQMSIDDDTYFPRNGSLVTS